MDRSKAPAGHGRLSHLKILLHFVRLNYQAAMEYRTSFLMQIVFMALNNAVFLGFWWVFFERFQDVQGWQLRDVLVLYGVGAASFGLATAIFGNTPRLGYLISEGHLDAHLSQPGDPLMKMMASRGSGASLGDLFFGVGMYLAFVGFSPGAFSLYCLLILISATVFLSFWCVAQSLAFWLGSSGGIPRTLGESILTFALYPEGLFVGPTRWMLYTLIPAGFVTYIPVRLIRNPDPVELSGYLVVALGFAVFARRFFQRGLRRYESGNQIVVQV